MDRRRKAGSTTSTMALVLVLLVGAGAWNYHRNVRQERAGESGRPYAGYSVREVQLLREAAGTELVSARARVAKARSRNAILDAELDLSEHERLAATLDRELAARAELGAGMARHVKRLTTF
ncbi:hypothetical protein K2X89_10295 [Myxococcota bacterium]|nr:hypothetical protein [Myxococcota bacterium]